MRFHCLNYPLFEKMKYKFVSSVTLNDITKHFRGKSFIHKKKKKNLGGQSSGDFSPAQKSLIDDEDLHTFR
jgi:hypothetical protein